MALIGICRLTLSVAILSSQCIPWISSGFNPSFIPHLSTAIKRTRHFRDMFAQSGSALSAKPSTSQIEDDTNGHTRRDLLHKTYQSLPVSLALSSWQKSSAVATTDAGPEPLADLPMRRLKLPRGGVGREYVIIQLKVQGQGPYDFMVDSGLTTEMITPHLQKELRIGSTGKMVQGLAAGGGGGGALVDLKGASLCCGKFSDPAAQDEFPLPTLTAIVTDFPQEHMDPAHDPVEGMLGMELLEMFDVDFDFPAGRFRLWKPGSGAIAASKAGLVDIPAVVLNESGLLGIRVTSPQLQPGGSQPLLGIIDCGASFSAANWAAAPFLGLPPKTDAGYRKSPQIVGVGVDGRPLPLPLAGVQLTFSGDATKDEDGRFSFAPPPMGWKPWKPIQMGIGDLPVFSQLLGDGRTPYQGPAVLVGLDVLSQRRVMLETSGGRRRRLLVSPS